MLASVDRTSALFGSSWLQQPQSINPASTDAQHSSTDTVSLSDEAIARAKQSAESVPSTNRYDFTQTTPANMKTISNQLFKEGQIDLEQLLTLQSMGVPLGHAGPNGEFIPLTAEERAGYENSPVDYLATTRSSIQFLEQSGYASDPKSNYKQLKAVLATLTSLQR
jgi:hypothetical protein